jgi:transcriptional regulator with XRE-family HTH domain
MKDKLERWREILVAAKPEGWKWQPPKTLSPVEPKEPPQEAKVRMDESIKTLPDDEREILQLRFVDGFTQEEIANAIGCKPLLIALIEQRAVERLAEAFKDLFKNLDDEIARKTVRFWVAWWGEQKSKELEALMPKTLTPTTECLSIGRIYEASLRWDWTEEEWKHIRSCARCRDVFNKVSEKVWHPSLRQLFDYVVENRLAESEKLDIRYHLEEDRCKACTLIVEGILKPLVAMINKQKQIHIVFRLPLSPHVGLVVSRRLGEQRYHIFTIATPLLFGFKKKTKEMKVKEGNLKAELKYEPNDWIVLIEAFNVLEDLRVRFTSVPPEGVKEVEEEIARRALDQLLIYIE